MNQKELLLISATIFLTIIAWMLVDIYKIKYNALIEARTSFTPVANSKLDTRIFEILKSREP